MKLEKITNFLENKYNLKLAEKWDNSGLIIGKTDREISKILICLDITMEVIEQAVRRNAKLIISHHPIIFREIKRITGENLTGQKILKLIENKIAVYSMHTNVDSALEGLNDYLLEKLELNGKKSILIKNDNSPDTGLGRILELDKEIDIYKLINLIKQRLNLEYLRIAGNKEKKVKKIALLSGSGGSLISEIDKSIDVYITGDLKHHETLDAIEENLTLIDLGHYESEIIFSELIKKDLEKFFDGELIQAEEREVFKIL